MQPCYIHLRSSHCCRQLSSVTTAKCTSKQLWTLKNPPDTSLPAGDSGQLQKRLKLSDISSSHSGHKHQAAADECPETLSHPLSAGGRTWNFLCFTGPEHIQEVEKQSDRHPPAGLIRILYIMSLFSTERPPPPPRTSCYLLKSWSLG